jgi:hypothetical protein
MWWSVSTCCPSRSVPRWVRCGPRADLPEGIGPLDVCRAGRRGCGPLDASLLRLCAAVWPVGHPGGCGSSGGHCGRSGVAPRWSRSPRGYLPGNRPPDVWQVVVDLPGHPEGNSPHLLLLLLNVAPGWRGSVQVVAACGSQTVPRSSPASPRCGPRWSRSPRCPRMCAVWLWRISWQSNRSPRKAVPRMLPSMGRGSLPPASSAPLAGPVAASGRRSG